MGGLKDKLPVTYWTFLVGSLALAGFPLTAGFFSKDDLLVSSWSAGPLGQVLTICGLLTAGLTAFYSFRLVFVTFWGKSRVDPHHASHVHEPSTTMTAPLAGAGRAEYRRRIPRHSGVSGTGLPREGAAAHHEGSAAYGIMALATLMGLRESARPTISTC